MALEWGACGDFNKLIQAFGVLRDPSSSATGFQVRTEKCDKSQMYRNISVKPSMMPLKNIYIV